MYSTYLSLYIHIHYMIDAPNSIPPFPNVLSPLTSLCYNHKSFKHVLPLYYLCLYSLLILLKKHSYNIKYISTTVHTSAVNQLLIVIHSSLCNIYSFCLLLMKTFLRTLLQWISIQIYLALYYTSSSVKKYIDV